MTRYCSCGKQTDDGIQSVTVHSITNGEGKTHNFDGTPCFDRCPQLGVFIMAKPGESPSRLVSIDSKKTVPCQLEVGHPGDHQYEDIWHRSWEAANS